MRIILNLCGTGTNNNGGSHTLIKSANTIQDLGHEIIIVDQGPSKYTWEKIKVPYIKTRDINDISGDVIIATGTGSIPSTNKSKIKNKFIYVRGFETWNLPENKLISVLKESKTIKIVNSIGLQKKLKQYNIQSSVIYPGYDFDETYPLNIRKENTKVVLGGLYNEGKKRSNKRTQWIFDVYNLLKKKYNISLYMFGSDGSPSILDFIKNPSKEIKNRIYNKIDIWLSPSCLEGLHIPPAEAMLTECCIVGNNSELSGTSDYLIHNETGLVSENKFNSFLDNVEYLINNKEKRIELGKSGRQKILSLGSREKNMLVLLNFLRNFK